MTAVPFYWASLFLVFLRMTLNMQKCVTLALPLAKRDVGAAGLEVPPPEIMRFMRRFGYLEPNTSGDSEALYHESAIVEAIKNIQKYGALNQSGKLDNETLELFSKPRCGVPDIEGVPYYLSISPRGVVDAASGHGRGRSKRFVIGARTWTKRRIQYFIANWSLKIPVQQVERDISRAFSLWARYSGLHFTRINDTSADIIVGFGSRYHGDNFPFDGSGNILAHAYYPYEMGSWGGDVHFDEDENWRENSTDLGQGVDFYSVAVHELGHALGLAHSPIYTSIMFPYYKGPEHNALDYDDTLAMYEMYLVKKLEDDNAELNEEEREASDDFGTTEITSTTEVQTMSPTEEIQQTAETTATPTYRGDFTTITEHKNLNGFSTPPLNDDEMENKTLASFTTSQPVWSTVRSSSRPELSQIPHICEGNFDAVAVLNGSVHIFKREYVWKLTARYTVMRGYPRSIYEMFPFLPPEEVKCIDAAFVRQDGAGVFFTGRTYWVFNGSAAIEESPRSITELIGSDESAVEQVNAAMLWPKNNFTYIFAGAKFWRFNDGLHTLDAGYPKSMKRWPGIPDSIDAAATLANGKTYFFKDNLYWLYNNALVRPERGYPRRASSAWLGCEIPTKTMLRNFNTTVAFISS